MAGLPPVTTCSSVVWPAVSENRCEAHAVPAPSQQREHGNCRHRDRPTVEPLPELIHALRPPLQPTTEV